MDYSREDALSFKLNAIAYKSSGPALIDLMGGQIAFEVNQLSSSAANIQSGALRLFGYGISSLETSSAAGRARGGRSRLQAQVRENLLNRRPLKDRRNNLQLTATVWAESAGRRDPSTQVGACAN